MIHQYKFGGQNIVLDVCSGGVHVVDDLAYDLISMFESHTKEETVNKLTEKYSEEVTRDEVMECWEQVGKLKKAGMLFSEDSFEPLQDELK